MPWQFTEDGDMRGGLYTKTSILYSTHTLQDMFNYKFNVYSRGYYLRFLTYVTRLYQKYLEHRVPFHIARLIGNYVDLDAHLCIAPPIPHTILISHHLCHLFTFSHPDDSHTVTISTTFQLLTPSNRLRNIVTNYMRAYKPCRLQTSYLRFRTNSRILLLNDVTEVNDINDVKIQGPSYTCDANDDAIAKCTRQITLDFVGLYNYFNTIRIEKTASSSP